MNLVGAAPARLPYAENPAGAKRDPTLDDGTTVIFSMEYDRESHRRSLGSNSPIS
jgi:hypothetical protein